MKFKSFQNIIYYCLTLYNDTIYLRRISIVIIDKNYYYFLFRIIVD